MAVTKDLFLAIDNGSQSVRALVFDQHGELLAKSRIEIEPYVAPEPGWAEQDPEYYWQSVCEACQQIWAKAPQLRNRLMAVSVTTQRGTVVPLDSDGQPVYPAITWMDQRRVEGEPNLTLLEKAVMKLLGVRYAVGEFFAEAESNWLASEKPELWQRVHKYLLLSGYHTYRLTGNYRDAVACQVGYLPFEFKTQDWVKDGEWRWRAQPVTKDQLPELFFAGETLGHITAQAAEQTGIPEGLPLIASGSDKACEVLGAGCLDETVGSLSYGTTATFNATRSTYGEVQAYRPSYPGIIPHSFNLEMMVQRGYWMVSWFKREFGLREESLAAERGVAAESLFDDLLRSVPPGSMGLTLQPYWSSGQGSPGPEAKGAIIGFGDVHTRAHIYRAMIEGLTYALREGKEQVEHCNKKSIKALRVSGGGSQSDEIMQITADVFGMTAERPHTFETSGLGAAIACAVGVGVHKNFDEAVAAMTRPGDRFEPIDEHRKLYDQLYHQVYKKMYGTLKPKYQAIRKIIGYPA